MAIGWNNGLSWFLNHFTQGLKRLQAECHNLVKWKRKHTQKNPRRRWTKHKNKTIIQID